MSRYKMERHISGMTLADASVDVLTLLKAEMTAAFDQLKIDAGLPSDALPLWRLSWIYDDEPEVKP